VPGQMHTPLVEARLARQRTGGDLDLLLKQRVARIPLGFMGDGRDTAHAVLFLASDEARFITGTEINGSLVGALAVLLAPIAWSWGSIWSRGRDLPEPFVSAAWQMILGSVGAAPATGEYRLAFDTVYLSDGISIVIVGLAMFATPEVVDILRRHVRISSTQELGSGTLRGFAETLRHGWLVIRCSSIGTALGALPGMGGPVITWVAYGHVAQSVKDRDMLGKGDIRGVIGPESANNADNGGAMIPALMFGIPASGSMAIFLGGLILIGVEPGIGMLERHLDLTFLIIWSLALANVIGTGLCLLLARPISRITLVPFAMVAPFMIAIIYFAAYQVTRSWYDVITLFVLGVLGVYMKRFGWSPPALLIGFVLSPRLEVLLYQSIQVYGYSFLARTGVQIILALIVLSIFVAVRVRPVLTFCAVMVAPATTAPAS